MVASAVEGLTPDQVTIASSDGTMLRAAGRTSQPAAARRTTTWSHPRLRDRRSPTRLTELARTLTGQPGATVEVRAVIDFTQSTVEKEVIDPTKNTPTAEHTTTETWTGTGVQPPAAPSDATAGRPGHRQRRRHVQEVRPDHHLHPR